MASDALTIFIHQLLQTVVDNAPPPPIPPDLTGVPQSEIDLMLNLLGQAGTAGDPMDMTEAMAGQAERDAQLGDALTKFPANEDQSADLMQQLMGMAGQVPQTLSGAGQSLGKGAGGGQLFGQLSSLLQQGLQAGGKAAGPLAESASPALGGLGGAGDLLSGGAGGLGALAGTSPSSYLGPAVTPAAATFPSSGATAAAAPAAAAESAAMGRGGMGGYPMMPPHAGAGAAGATDAKADTKRVVPPAVKNGAPVQGRIDAPAKPPEVTKRVDGKPVLNRRRLVAEPKLSEDDAGRDT